VSGREGRLRFVPGRDKKGSDITVEEKLKAAKRNFVDRSRDHHGHLVRKSEIQTVIRISGLRARWLQALLFVKVKY
jgi:hypothetical protein